MENIYKMKRLYNLLALCLFVLLAKAQTTASFTHYSSEDGLSQNTVMHMLQDRRGNLWLSTWDGINRFDGYSFKNYKARLDNNINLSHNRIDKMFEDKYGFLWLQTYDGHAYRFDPRTEQFELVTAVTQQGASGNVNFIHLLPGGNIWILTEHEGGIRVSTSEKDYSFSCEEYSLPAGNLPAMRIHKVHEDRLHREWLLTDNGLTCLANDDVESSVSFFAEKESKTGSPFYTVMEQHDRLYFGSHKGRVWCHELQSGQFKLIQLPIESSVISIHALSTGEVIMVTAADGFFLYRPDNEETEHYAASRLPNARIISAYVDRHDEVWFEQRVIGTVAHFNPHTHTVRIERMAVETSAFEPTRPAFHIHEDCFGTLWVHPYGGGFGYYDREGGQLRPFYNNRQAGEWRFSNKLHSAFSDRQGNLWLCTHSKDLEKVSFLPRQFELSTPTGQPDETQNNEVRSLWEDAEHNLWVGLKGGKLMVMGAGRQELGYLTEAGTVSWQGTALRGNVYHIMQDRQGNFWISTKGDGLVKAEPVGNLCYKLTRYVNSHDNLYSLSDNSIYCTYEDEQGRIWVATFGGGINYLTRNAAGDDIFINHRNHLKSYPIDRCSKVRFITGDTKGNIWIGTTGGALRVNGKFRVPEEASFYHAVRIPNDLQSLSNNDVHWILPARSGELYFATFGGGLNKLTAVDDKGKARFRSYTMRQGLPSDVLLSIREDKAGNLWISTENGISKFDPKTEKFENYNDRDISHRIRFSEGASEVTSLGNVLFGTVSGICYFCPDSIRKSNYVPPIVLSDLLLANEQVVPGEQSVLKQTLDETARLELSHRENIFTIQYAALDYSAPDQIQYAYRLEGFEKTWNNVGRQRTATYTNLPKGSYVFKVRSTNADGVWTENTRSLPIEVLPSFWETPVAYLLYVLLVLAVIFIAVQTLFTFYRLKHRVSMERQMTDMKLRFFTDISHELRTPLTLISGPVEYVMENWKMPDEAREQLQVVERNTKRMLRLINQILDFRKIQNRKMKMQVQRVNVVAFTRKIMENFDAVAEEHRIDYLFETEKEELALYVDADKYEKIVFNLLSNAFKYTPNDKMITVFLHEDEHSVTVGVQDQGIGIPDNRRKSLFLRFENLVDKGVFNQTSTGIGLSLVKELVDMHRATIEVESKVGQGSCFTVTFLKGKEHYDETTEFLPDDMMPHAAMKGQVEEASGSLPVVADEEPAANEEAARTSGKELMLLVEDNAELRLFLRNIFASEYRVVEAENGVQGFEKAMKYLPDIIISDVMMPEKDGIELTRDLRDEISTSHIPIVLLTAKTAIESKLEGLEYGADDYITKPFSATYLKARVKNLLAQRRKLQELYRATLLSVPATAIENEEVPPTVVPEAQAEAKSVADASPALELSPNDRRFLDNLVAFMEKNIDNGDLVVDDLVKVVSLSRSVFFKKLKTLTGLAPVEFIREIRINRAALLIRTGEYTIAQIAYMVGINDPRYFSKCFKQQMGMTPTEYKEKKAEQGKCL